VETVADTSKTPLRPDAFFGVTQNQPPKFVGGGLQGLFSQLVWMPGARAEGKERLRSASVLVQTAICGGPNRLQDAV